MNVQERAEPKPTLSSSIYEELRAEILAADLMPGERLQTRSLGERFNSGLSPVREALSRLSSERLVARREHCGFIVAQVSEEDLDELTKTRCWLNEIGIRESIENGGIEWEEGIVLAFHRLVRTPRKPASGKGGRNPEWELAHTRFHQSLIAACGSRWLIDFSNQMFDAAGRYRHLARQAGNVRPPNREHREIMNAVIDRDAERAVNLLNKHLSVTAEMVRDVLRGRDELAVTEIRKRGRDPERRMRQVKKGGR
jgi:DNA-binding GntR family transcriptional regulator